MPHLWSRRPSHPAQPRPRADAGGDDRPDRRRRPRRDGRRDRRHPRRRRERRCPTPTPIGCTGSTPTMRPHQFPLSVVDYRALEADHPSFSAVAAYQRLQVTVADGDVAERVQARVVTGSYFPLLGQTAADRAASSSPSDDTRDDRIVVLIARLLAAAVRRRSVGARPDGDQSTAPAHTVVGVLRADVGSARTRHRGLLAGTLADADPQGAVLPDGAGAAAPRACRRRRRRQRCAPTNARLFPIWRSSYQDEKATWGLLDLKSREVGDVGLDARSSCWRRSAACCSSPAPTPSIC